MVSVGTYHHGNTTGDTNGDLGLWGVWQLFLWVRIIMATLRGDTYGDLALAAYGNVFCGYVSSWQHKQRIYVHSNPQKYFIRNRNHKKHPSIRKLNLSHIWQCFLGHSVSSWQRVWMKDLRLFMLRHHDTFEHVWTRYVGRNAGLRGVPRPGHLSLRLCSIRLFVMITVRPRGYHWELRTYTHTYINSLVT